LKTENKITFSWNQQVAQSKKEEKLPFYQTINID